MNEVLTKNLVRQTNECTNSISIEKNICSGSQKAIADNEKEQFFVGKPVGKGFTGTVLVQLSY